MDPATLPGLAQSWKLAMQAERKSPHTIDSYSRGVRLYLEWCASNSGTVAIDPLARRTLQAWVNHLLSHGAEPATARIRLQAVRRFAAWLADPEQGEIPADPFVAMNPPKMDAKVVERLTDDDLKRLLKACAGRELRDRRDEAMLRLLLETGMRAGELLALNVADLELARGVAVVRRGKGGKGRYVAFTPQTGAAIDRYLRVRKLHKLAATPALWLAETGGRDRLSYHGLRVALLARAAQAGVSGFHVHKLRHTFASRWLGAGGSEGGLMAAAGWSSREMIDRYSRATASERALDEARGLRLGDV
jgi:site-specific recombinase XerD